MLTQERAKYLLAHTDGGDLVYAYARECCGSHPYTRPDGITRPENDYLKKVWNKMPGNCCQYDALVLIANGRRDGARDAACFVEI